MKIKILTLNESERHSLTLGFRSGESHCFQMRCRAVAEIRRSEFRTCGKTDRNYSPSVNGWVKRFESNGIQGLYTRPGQGRKPIMDSSDEDAVHRAIESDRQSVRMAKEAWLTSSGKVASELTFRRFLSALAQDIDV